MGNWTQSIHVDNKTVLAGMYLLKTILLPYWEAPKGADTPIPYICISVLLALGIKTSILGKKMTFLTFWLLSFVYQVFLMWRRPCKDARMISTRNCKISECKMKANACISPKPSELLCTAITGCPLVVVLTWHWSSRGSPQKIFPREAVCPVTVCRHW